MKKRQRVLKTFVWAKRKSNPSVSGQYYPFTSTVPSKTIIYDEDKGITRTIVYSKREKSIYLDEIGKTLDEVKLDSITFRNGFLYAPDTDPNLMNYLETADYNQSKEGRDSTVRVRYFLQDLVSAKIKEGEERLRNARLFGEMMALGLEELISIATVLNIKEPFGLKDKNAVKSFYQAAVSEKIEDDPVGYEELFNDPSTVIASHLTRAWNNKIIEITSNSIDWVKVTGTQKKNIISIPAGEEPLRYFAKKVHDPEYKAKYDKIVEKLNKLIG